MDPMGYMVAPPQKTYASNKNSAVYTDQNTVFGLWSLETCLEVYMGIGFPERLLVVRSCLWMVPA